MRVLLIAYEFPPSPSPRALRWAYLARELAMLGHEVHVLAPRLAGDPANLPQVPESVRVHRTFAGPLMGLVQALARRRDRAASGSGAPTGTRDAGGVSLNWKGRAIEVLKHVAGSMLFPDIRREWNPWARHALRQLLPRLRPDVVVASHEPASVLELGLWAGRRGWPWLADLGDPIDAPYTPRRWKARAARLERRVSKSASHVVLTTRKAQSQFAARHAPLLHSSVITQGFDDRSTAQETRAGMFDPARLELVYTGRFYSFRRPDALLAAVAAMAGVRLTIAAPAIPDICHAYVEKYPESIRLLGALPHRDALALQRGGDLLINIGNQSMSAQTPGKLYEYLGAGRPILHLLAAGQDPAEDFFNEVAVGWTCPNEPKKIQRMLEQLRDMRRAQGRLAMPVNPRASTIAEYGWSRLGQRLESLLHSIAKTEQADAIDGHPQAIHIHH